MAKLIVISWRDIPSQVLVKRGRETAKVLLSKRFQEAIDRAAMRAGKTSSHDYINDWQRATPVDCGDDLQAEARHAAASIEARYSDADLLILIRAKGLHQNGIQGTPDQIADAATGRNVSGNTQGNTA